MTSTDTRVRLFVNIDHVATVRQARKTVEPDPVAAAAAAEQAGADGITAHLREDRRHIQDDDVRRLARSLRTPFNLEMACTREMLRIATELKPQQVTFVPEKREEITTEGGLALRSATSLLAESTATLRDAGCIVAYFVDPDEYSVRRSFELGASAVELHTGVWSHGGAGALEALRSAALMAHDLGLAVHAGHGLTTANVAPVAALPHVEELNIGHHIVSRAVLVGFDAAVREMLAAMAASRRGNEH